MSPTSNVQKQLYGIGIFEEEIILSDFTGDGEKRFAVSREQLMAFCRSEVTFRPFPGLLWMKTDGATNTYLLQLPAAQRTILYRMGKKLTAKRLHLPPLAVEAKFSADRTISGINLWGLARGTLKSDSVLYELPLPNLNGSRLCLGSTEKASDSDIRSAVEKTIFDTPFNHHNYLVGTSNLPFHEYVKKHKGRVPLSSLKRIGIGCDILGGAQ
ncbi:MAG: hypothetical protein A2075_09210 [Geobacteraceae bacterium GWC2_58_44]|nr:MAG: hypothetical protein A2075_09210 [Geobacteraceae bacterium GWC2_58_44]HBG07691.1 hypothetical protein [Geobacter sp.]